MSKILDLSTYVPGPGITLIEASAGTGKTYSIANLYLHFILQGKKVNEILVVTFTEAATKELRERIRHNLSCALNTYLTNEVHDETISKILAQYPAPQEKLEMAILNFDQAAIFTIHGFCQRMLQENAFESLSLFDSELSDNNTMIRERIVFDFWRKLTHTSETKPPLSQNQLHDLANKVLGSQNLNIAEPLVDSDAIEEALAQFKPFAEKCLATLELMEHCKDEVYELMFTGKVLNGNKYRINSFENKWSALQTSLTQQKHDIDILNYFGNKIADSASKGKEIICHELFDRCAEMEEMCLPDLENLLSQKIKADFIDFARQQEPKIKSELNILTFDDLITNLHRVLSQEQGDGPLHQRIREKYKIALVDEFQDTDPLQYQVFASLFGHEEHCEHHAFYMIGDPKQSIYRFRGADIFAYLEAKNQAQTKLTLDTNYRSEPAMVEAVNEFFLAKGSEEAFAYAPEDEAEGICFEAVKSGADKRRLIIADDPQALQLRWILPDAEDLDTEVAKSTITPEVPKLVSAEIIELLNKSQDGLAYFETKDGEREAVKPGDIAILVNSHNQAKDIKAVLNRAKISVVIQKSGNVFDSDQAKDLLRLLEAIADPRDRTITPLLLSGFFNHTVEEVKNMGDNQRFDLLKEFIDYNKSWESRGLLRSLQKFIDLHDLYTSSLKRDQGERLISNLYQLREILHTEETANGLGLTGLIRFLNEKINSEDKDDDAYLQRLETDAKAVQILTIHKSKGLEFPIVFCPYMWNQKYSYSSSPLSKGENNKSGDFEFHNDLNQPSFSIDPSGDERDDFRKFWSREVLGEQLRLLYVALTRAANRCYLYWGNIKNEPSLFSYLALPDFKGRELIHSVAPELEVYQRRQAWEKTLKNRAPHAIGFKRVCFDDETPRLRYREVQDDQLQAPAQFELNFPSWMDGSYSALTRGHGKVHFTPDDLKLHDEGETDDVEVDDLPASGFYSFPRGAMPGVAIHEIFEYIDFQDPTHWDEVISSKLKRYNLHGGRTANPDSFLEKRVGDCHEMLQRVLSTKLTPCDFSLDQVSRSQRMDEMEFYYPVENIDLQQLKKLFFKYYQNTANESFIEDLDKLNYQMQQGFFNGSIDLAFQQDGRFYVLDWKSNHLGNSPEKYDTQSLRNAVREHFYFLQYHIYTLALHLFLEQHLHDYDYEKHFGGCIYTFVRGFKPGSSYGIHFDRLPLAMVEELKQLIVNGVAVHG